MIWTFYEICYESGYFLHEFLLWTDISGIQKCVLYTNTRLLAVYRYLSEKSTFGHLLNAIFLIIFVDIFSLKILSKKCTTIITTTNALAFNKNRFDCSEKSQQSTKIPVNWWLFSELVQIYFSLKATTFQKLVFYEIIWQKWSRIRHTKIAQMQSFRHSCPH